MGGEILFRRRLQPSVKVDLIPMIDIVFQLVVFFMVTSTLSQLPGIEIVMPKATTAEIIEINQFTITIGEQDNLFLNDESISIKSLEMRLRDIPVADREEKSVIVRGDHKASLGQFITVLDLLRKNGFNNYAVPVSIAEM